MSEISDNSRQYTVELLALPARIAQTRRILGDRLREWSLDPLVDRAALGLTELLTNVHRHARPDKSCTVGVEVRDGRLIVSVSDNDPRLPVLRAADPSALRTCGRGMALIEAVSESWGARHGAGRAGKVIWFSLRTGDAERAATPAGSRPRAR
ncbi:ATP-binding protein [Streptomyces sp. BI20]|uniref:ATP-binding protein n=1 Tax=Streptomyces sp. BI20 TaxID=3403460 RepID=UPI003C77686B